MDKLSAEFNRWTLSRRDFEEAQSYLNAFNSSMDPIVQRALLSAAIIAYARPFSHHHAHPKAEQKIKLPADFFDAESLDLHERVLTLRNKCIAHSDYDRKPTARIPIDSTGVMTRTKPFNPLYEGIDIVSFRDLNKRMELHCWDQTMRLNNQMNGAPAPERVRRSGLLEQKKSPR